MAARVPDILLPSKGVIVFSGGSAANSLVDVFDEITQRRQSSLSYIIPISDNGGSSSELIRVFGGPGIGDIRSRLVRLIPPNQPAIHALLNQRLSPSPEPALQDWQALVAGTSSLWTPIPPAPRELLRSMLNHVNFEIMKRARPPTSTFDFSHASVGNLFLTGARLFTGSFESAIHLLGLICGISEHVTVVPAINSNFSHHISAGLANGDVITGQNAISHPSAPTALRERPAALEPPSPAFNAASAGPTLIGADSGISTPYSSSSMDASNVTTDAHAEDANLPGSLPTLRQSAINFSKEHSTDDDLPSPIARIWHINPYGQEISPFANPRAVSVIKDAEAVIYSIGSLYTSIVPCLILRGIGEAIASNTSLRSKILILNGSLDRETGPRAKPMEATDFVAAIARAGEESKGWRADPTSNSELPKDMWKRYVTHIIYLEGEGAPQVDRRALAEAGVECVRCWGRKGAQDGTWRYDPAGLVGALEAILGRGGDKGGKQSRRNTMEAYASPLPSPR